MYTKELILVAYMLGILLICFAITIAFLGRNKGDKEFNKAMMLFAAGMLISFSQLQTMTKSRTYT